MGFFRRDEPDPGAPVPVRWVRAATALHQPEAEMLQGMLEAEGIPVMIRRATVDVPEMLAGGPRAVMVPVEHADRAREILTPEDGEPSAVT
jgi:hypothetical protein